MKRRPVTLIEVLQPRAFQGTPERARATRTIIQPEIDLFEQLDSQSTPTKSARTGRQGAHASPQLAPV